MHFQKIELRYEKTTKFIFVISLICFILSSIFALMKFYQDNFESIAYFQLASSSNLINRVKKGNINIALFNKDGKLIYNNFFEVDDEKYMAVCNKKTAEVYLYGFGEVYSFNLKSRYLYKI